MDFHIAVSLLDLTTGGRYPEVAVTSGTITSSFQPTLTMDPKPISTRSSSSSAQSTTQSISGAKSDQVTMIVVPLLLTILILIAIGVGIFFWKGLNRLPKQETTVTDNCVAIESKGK